jgi:hypothetical protein
MKPNLSVLSKTATRILCALSASAALLVVVGCGDGGGDGAEDTGSILLVSVTSLDRNVDIAPDDTDNDGVIDNPLTDTTISMSFTNRSVVPDVERPATDTTATSDTDTFLRVVSYRIDYSTSDPTAPQLQSREFFTTFWNGLVDAEETVERGDIMLVALATVAEFNQKVAAGAVPTDAVPEYVAHYTFSAETARFSETQTAEANVSFSFADFLPE